MDEFLESSLSWVVGTVFIVLIFFIFLLTLAKRYKRCPANRILVIFGKVRSGRPAKCLHGGGAFVWPLIQNYSFLYLDPIQIDIPLKDALSAENIRVNVPSVFTVAIGTKEGIMDNAAIRLLGLSVKDITQQARDIIFGQLRQVIASMGIEDINRDRDKFLESIQTSLEPELNKIGLVLINVNITDITDNSGYIEAIGRKAAAEAVQQAEIDVAQQTKLGAIGVAEANREKTIAVANAQKVQEIGVAAADRERAIEVASFLKEKAVGEQSAAYERDSQIKDREQAMRISIADANARAVVGENEAKAEIASSAAELRVKEAEAYLLGEARQREAQAQVESRQNLAQAKAAEANATRIEAEKRAELEAPARAHKARIAVEAEAEADRRRIEAEGRATAMRVEAQGEAEATFARREAEARGEYELLARKAEGLREIVAACGTVEEAFQMLMLEHLDHLATTSSKALSNIKFDKVTVWDAGNGAGGASGFLRSLGTALPPLMDVMKNLGGVELPKYFGRLAGVDEEAAGETDGRTPAEATDGAGTGDAAAAVAKTPPATDGKGGKKA